MRERRLWNLWLATVALIIVGNLYHYPGYRWYGTTQAGKFVHEAEAVAEGDRAAMNERHPVNFESAAQPWRR